MSLREAGHRVRSGLRAAVTSLSRLTDARAVLLLFALGVALALPGVLVRAEPNSDGLYYEQRTERLRGASESEARRDVFGGERAAEVARIEDQPSGVVRVLDPDWVEYSEQFYERRWLVPGLAVLPAEAGLSVPRSLQAVSMLGYALIAAALFLLLRLRFPVGVSVIAAAACMLWPPLYRWSFGTFVDSWGVLMLTLGLLALLLAIERGPRWLPVWGAAMLALSFTRDATMVLGIAALWVAVGRIADRRTWPRSAWTLLVGLTAALPALLIGGAPVRENLAYIQAGYKIPGDSSWADVLAGYPDLLWTTISGNATYPLDLGLLGPPFYLAIVAAAALIVYAIARRPRHDAFWLATRGAALGCVALLLVANNPQGYRLELVFLPVVAVGLARALTAAAGVRAESLRARPQREQPIRS